MKSMLVVIFSIAAQSCVTTGGPTKYSKPKLIDNEEQIYFTHEVVNDPSDSAFHSVTFKPVSAKRCYLGKTKDGGEVMDLCEVKSVQPSSRVEFNCHPKTGTPIDITQGSVKPNGVVIWDAYAIANFISKCGPSSDKVTVLVDNKEIPRVSFDKVSNTVVVDAGSDGITLLGSPISETQRKNYLRLQAAEQEKRKENQKIAEMDWDTNYWEKCISDAEKTKSEIASSLAKGQEPLKAVNSAKYSASWSFKAGQKFLASNQYRIVAKIGVSPHEFVLERADNWNNYAAYDRADLRCYAVLVVKNPADFTQALSRIGHSDLKLGNQLRGFSAVASGKSETLVLPKSSLLGKRELNIVAPVFMLDGPVGAVLP